MKIAVPLKKVLMWNLQSWNFSSLIFRALSSLRAQQCINFFGCAKIELQLQELYSWESYSTLLMLRIFNGLYINFFTAFILISSRRYVLFSCQYFLFHQIIDIFVFCKVASLQKHVIEKLIYTKGLVFGMGLNKNHESQIFIFCSMGRNACSLS